MPEPTPQTQPPEAKPRVIPASTVVREEPGIRPLPWPLWAGPQGSVRGALVVLALWSASLLLALTAKRLCAHGFTGSPWLALLFSCVTEHLPWTLAVLWLLYAGFGFSIALVLVCALIGADPAAPWFSETLALIAFAGLLQGFPFDPCLRSLSSLGLFTLAAFGGAVACSMAGAFHGDPAALAIWEQLWSARFAEDLAVTAPLAFVLGPSLERRKRMAFGSLPAVHGSVRQQALALLLAFAAVTAFCVTWTLAADVPVELAVRAHVREPLARAALDQAQRATASRKAALVALLLGAVCTGGSLIIALLRRYRAELRAEVRRNTEAFRRRHAQMAALQQVTESVNRSLDPDAVFEELARTMVRLTDPAQVTVYVPDEQDGGVLRLARYIARRPPQFAHRQRLPVAGSITGQCFRNGSTLSVPRNLLVYVDAESVRAQFQQHNLDAFLAVPIVGEHAVLGVVSMTFDHAYAPDEEEHRLFRLIGRAVGAALERAATHVKARRYAGDLGGLYRLSQQLAAESDEAQILAVAATAGRRLLRAQATAALLCPPGDVSGPVRCAACDGVPEKTALVRQTVFTIQEPGLLAEAIREVRTVSVGLRTLASVPQLLARGWEERSVVAVPLPGSAPDAGAAGALLWVFDGREPFGLEEVGLAEEIARQTAAGLRRARLIAQTRQQAEELRLFEQIGRSLSQRLTLTHTLEQTVQNVCRIAPAKFASLYTLDQASQTLHLQATGRPLDAAPQSFPLSRQTIMAACLKEGRTLVVPDTQQDPRCDAEVARRVGAASVVSVPLGPPAQRFGVLLVAKPQPGAFCSDDVRRIEHIAQMASAAIERARLYEEACQRADELILLNEVGHLLVESPALEGTLLRIAELVCRNSQLTGAGFLLLDESREALLSRGIFGLPAPAARQLRIPLQVADITTQALRQNQTLIVENAATDKRLHRLLRKLLPGVVSGAVIPMAGTKGPAGVFCVWNASPRFFQPRELQCLAGVARLAAAAVGRGELVQALQASERRLQELVDGIHAIIVSVDPRGAILSFNSAAERITGRRQHEVLGLSLAGVANLSTAERAKLERFITRAFATLDCSEQLVLNWPSSEGGERKIRWRSSFLRRSDGQLTGMVCLCVDITEQMLLEAQLLQAQKMESVGALAGGMAHDFNNLLGGIIGQCAVSRSQTRDARILASLANIESAAQRGADLTSKLMAFARKSVLQPRAVDIGALIEETATLLSGSLPHSISIVSHIAPPLPPVHGDPTQLQQVLLNLCVNARDAMPQGGTLTLSASAAPVGSGSPPVAPGVVLEVGDTGTGMTDEVQQHLYEPFFTTKQPGKGTGLGLSVVFGIVRSHGGQITCRSRLGAGTHFSVYLPRARPPSARAEPGTGSRAGMPAVSASQSQALAALPFTGTEAVLLVDDDAILRDTVRQLLQNLGYTVRTAAGGVEALEILDSGRDFVPAVVLLDVVMPGLAGLTLLAALRQRLSGVPVVLMSGYSADQTVIGLLDAGARELLQKPFTLEALAGAIRRAVAPQQPAAGSR